MALTKKPAKVGRPTKYTKKLSQEICERLSDGESLRSICRDDHVPARVNIHRWLLATDNKLYNEFRIQYALARDIQAETLVDEIFDIADNGSNDYMEKNDPDNPGYVVNGEALGRSRLRVDTRKWHASKIIKRYKDDYKGDGGGETLADALLKLASRLPS